MPGPALVHAPAPVIAPLSVETEPVSAKNAPPPAFNVIALVEVIPASASSVPPLKLSGPVPKLPLLLTARMPPLRFVPPLYVFAALKVKVPGPVLVHAPTPPIAPLKIEVVPVSAKNVPPPALSVIALLETSPPPAASASSVPPLKVSSPVPKLLSLFTARMPPLRFVPPVYVFAPVSVSVPVPTFVSDPPTPPGPAGELPSWMTPETVVLKLLPPALSALLPRK